MAAAIDMEDDDDIWGNTASSPSPSPPQPISFSTAGAGAGPGAFISTQLSLNSRLHLLTSSGGGSVSPTRGFGCGGGSFAADGVHHHMPLGGGGGGGGFRNNAVAPPAAAPFFPYSLDAADDVSPFDARGVLDDEMCLGGAAGASAAWAGGGGGGGSDRRKKRMIKNRESAARSRARKQAYVRELERKVQMLQLENESLRVKYDQLRVSVEVAVPMVRKTLQRMPSAPF